MTSPEETAAQAVPLFDPANPFMEQVHWQVPTRFHLGHVQTPNGPVLSIVFRTGQVTAAFAFTKEAALGLADTLRAEANRMGLHRPTPGLIIPR